MRNSDFEFERAKKGSAGNTDKLDNSLTRTKTEVFELAICNEWEYMVTLTLSPEKYDRYNLRLYVKALGKFLNNYNYQRSTSIKYLLIPEEHEDGAWHMHGFFLGIPDNHLAPFVAGVHPQHLIDGDYRNWPAYAERFGFCSLSRIRDAERCAAYVTKYITKHLRSTSVELNYHMYYASHGLQRAVVLRKDRIARELLDADFRNEYVAVKVLRDADEANSYFYDD